MGNGRPMNRYDKILFITGSRADYGKLKSLIGASEEYFETHVFVCGMHLLEKYGNTYTEIIHDGYKNVYLAKEINFCNKMDIDLASTIVALNKYIDGNRPDLIVCHGDRIDALAGSISGMLNNILVAHVEGGEVTGTVDEAIRHAITKMAHYHFVSNVESKLRIIQLGEKEENVHVIGSPDIDIMHSEIPNINNVKVQYDITFDQYAIFIYHPVTTENDSLEAKIDSVLEALDLSGLNFVVIYPNNDLGSDTIIHKIEKLNEHPNEHPNFKTFNSIKFEDFLSLLKHSKFIIGNSSAGIREACVYGIPSINIGTRQNGRYNQDVLKNIQQVDENSKEILDCIAMADEYSVKSNYFGDGNSANLFINALLCESGVELQKRFIDMKQTKSAIDNYINEVCF